MLALLSGLEYGDSEMADDVRPLCRGVSNGMGLSYSEDTDTSPESARCERSTVTPVD